MTDFDKVTQAQANLMKNARRGRLMRQNPNSTGKQRIAQDHKTHAAQEAFTMAWNVLPVSQRIRVLQGG